MAPASRAAGRRALALAWTLGAAFPAAARAGELLPPSKELFPPLIADPGQPRYELRWTVPEGSRRVGEIAMGDELGLWRAASGGFQVGAEGGVIGRFDISRVTNDIEVADYTFALPADLALGPASLRLAYWHVSSHLGDDYIRLNAPSLAKATTDEVRTLASWRRQGLRLYGGWAWAFHVLPGGGGRSRAQAGAELGGPRLGSGRLFAAADLQLPERADWDPDLAVRAGWRVPGRAGAVSFFVEFYEGHLPYQQFMARRETHVAAGLGFEMGTPVHDPL